MTTVLVTRPAGQERELVELLAAADIEAVAVPTVEIRPTGDGDLERALATLSDRSWLVVTSVNGAHAVAGAAAGRSLPPGTRVAAVGPATAAALAAGGLRVDAMPERFLTSEIAGALGEVDGHRVVLARADLATPGLREALVARGALVREIVAYRTLVGPPASRDAMRSAIARGIDGVLFTSGSTVRGAIALLPPQLRQRLTATPAFCLGPVTAEVARRAGFTVTGVAQQHTAAGLAAITSRHFARENA
jgi:uroporphyrinogen-III synthase